MAFQIWRLTDYWSVGLYPWEGTGMYQVSADKRTISQMQSLFQIPFPEAWESHLHFRTGEKRFRVELGIAPKQKRDQFKVPQSQPPFALSGLATRQLAIEHPPGKPLTFAEVDAAAFQYWLSDGFDATTVFPPSDFPLQTIVAGDTLFTSDRLQLTAFDQEAAITLRIQPITTTQMQDLLSMTPATIVHRVSHQQTVDWWNNTYGTSVVFDPTPLSITDFGGKSYILLPFIGVQFPFPRIWSEDDLTLLTPQIQFLLVQVF